MQYVMHKNRILSPNNKASQISSISLTATQINMKAQSSGTAVQEESEQYPILDNTET